MASVAHEQHPDNQIITEVERLMQEAHAAHAEFTAASKRFATLVEQETETLAELLNVAMRIHEAKVKADRALKGIRNLTGLTEEPASTRPRLA